MFCIILHNDYAKWGPGNATLRSHQKALRDFCIMRLLLFKHYAKLCKNLCKKLYPCHRIIIISTRPLLALTAIHCVQSRQPARPAQKRSKINR